MGFTQNEYDNKAPELKGRENAGLKAPSIDASDGRSRGSYFGAYQMPSQLLSERRCGSYLVPHRLAKSRRLRWQGVILKATELDG